MPNNFKIVNGAIGALVNPGQSFTIPYPAGTVKDTFYSDGNIFIVNNVRIYSDPSQASISFGTSDITVTNNTTQPWLNGDSYEIQLNMVPVKTFEGDVEVVRNLYVGGVKVADPNGLLGTQLWVMPCFSSTQERLCLLTSGDGKAWRYLASDIYSNPNGGKVFRDPSMIYINGIYWIAYSNISSGPNYTGDSFNIAKSVDLVNWTAVATVTIPGSPTNVWSPEWFMDTDGSVSIFFAASFDSQTNFAVYNISPTDTAGFTTWATPILAFGTTYKPIDPFVFKENGVYYLWYKNESTTYIEVASSITRTGSYTRIKSGDWAGWGAHLEGPSISILPDGRYRIYVDPYASSLPSYYKYAESSSLLSGWSALTSVTATGLGFADMRHGTPKLLPLTETPSVQAALALLTPFLKLLLNYATGFTQGLMLELPLRVSQDGSFAQIQLQHKNGSGTYNGTTWLQFNDSCELHKGMAANGAATFLAQLAVASGALTWYGSIASQKPTSVKTTAYSLNSVTDNGVTFTNTGATARVDFTLPSAAANMIATFIVQDADGIRVNAASGDTIRIAGSVTAAAGHITNTTVGSAVTLQAINATEWIALNSVGTWAFDD